MTVSSVGFHWLAALEKQFDCAVADLDVLLGGGFLEDVEEVVGAQYDELEVSIRQKLASLSVCWSELCHKSETVFQNHAKLEASLLLAQDQLSEAVAARKAVEAENQQLLTQLHSVQLQLHGNTDQASPQSPSSVSPSQAEHIRKKLDSDLAASRRSSVYQQKLLNDNCLMLDEQRSLRRSVAELQSELVGHRLLIKYMDRELAGRMQQLQMLGRGVDSPQLERIWHQLDAEIRVHRHKLLFTTCRAREKIEASVAEASVHDNGPITLQVDVKRSGDEPLGISIMGGEVEAVPILVASIKPNGAVGRCGRVRPGDTILSVNEHSLEQVTHQQAVQILSSLQGDVAMKLLRPSENFCLQDNSSGHNAFRFFGIGDDRLESEKTTSVLTNGEHSLESASEPAPTKEASQANLQTPKKRVSSLQ